MLKLRICGFDVSVTFGFLFVVSLLSLSQSAALGLTAVCACIIHELGHCFAAVILNVKFKSLTLWAGGILIQRESRIITSASELFILFCGPLFSFVSGVLFWFFGKNSAAAVNLMLAFFNLLPYSSLDGGSIIKVITERINPYSETIQKSVAVLTGTAILAFLIFSHRVSITAFATIILLTADELTPSLKSH